MTIDQKNIDLASTLVSRKALSSRNLRILALAATALAVGCSSGAGDGSDAAEAPVHTAQTTEAMSGDIGVSFDNLFDNGQDGRAVTAPPSGTTSEDAAAAVRQADGKIVVVGTARSPNANLYVRRYNASGSVDATFGTLGRATAPLSSTGLSAPVGVFIIPSTGAIVVAGSRDTVLGTCHYIARFTPNGGPDLNYAPNGTTSHCFVGQSAVATDADMQADGRVVIGGYFGGGRSALVRYDAKGQPDSSFGPGGIAATAPTGNRIDAVRVAGSQIYVTTSTGGRTAVVRYNGNGAIDTTWGSLGATTLPAPLSGQLLAIAVQPWDNKVVVAGYGVAPGNTRGFQSAFVARIAASGLMDQSFATGGVYENSVGSGLDEYVGLAFLADHTILAMGQTQVPGTSRPTGLVSRYDATGKLYPSFALAGNFVQDAAPYVSSFFAQTAIKISETTTSGQVMLLGTDHTGAALMQYYMSVL